MKSNVIVIALISIMLLSGCNKSASSEEEKVAGKNNFSVVIEGIFAKNDKIQVFYLLKGDVWKDDNSVSQTVYASNQMQKIEVDFPEKVVPENIRVDLGFNITQENVTIKNISVKYKSNIINGDFDKFTKYFYPNEFVTWDPNYFGYKLSVINEKYDPFLMGNDQMAIQIAKITK